MKIKRNEIKSCRTAYLYEDGHMVLVHEKRDHDAGAVNWVTIYEDINIKCNFSDHGRIIIDKEVLPFLQIASHVTAKKASINQGSENTKQKGIAVESITLKNGLGEWGWHISNLPDIISSAIYYQPETNEIFNDVKNEYHWSDYKIKNVYTTSTPTL